MEISFSAWKLSGKTSVGTGECFRQPHSSARERLPEDLGGMLRPAPGKVIDLLATGNAWRDDLGGGRFGLDGGNESSVPDRHRDVVVLRLETEGAGHPAAARIDLGHLEAGPGE